MTKESASLFLLGGKDDVSVTRGGKVKKEGDYLIKGA